MDFARPQAIRTADFIREKISLRPTIGLITGTGLGGVAQWDQAAAVIPFSDIPGFPVSTAPGHAGRVVAGKWHSEELLAFEGRFHLYEGHSSRAVTFPVRVLQALGIRSLILTNAAGGINPKLSDGDILIITDHINLTGQNPLVGSNDDEWGIRFPDMGKAYDPFLTATAEDAALRSGIRVRRGVYAGLLGPSLETPAEVKFLRTIGADVVGFSTVLETLAAVHGGMRILGLSLVTNVHDPDNPRTLTADQVISAAQTAAPKLAKLIREIIVLLDSHGTL